MRTGGPVVLVGIDAGNPALLREYARAGHLPRLARVLRDSARAELVHEPGLFVGSIWPTLLTGTGVDRHGFFTGIRPAPRSYEYTAAPVQGEPFWETVAAAGHRAAVIDAPFFPAKPGSTVDHIVEWGCHDRYYGTSSSPPELIDDVLTRIGRHPIGMLEHELERFAPCDWVHRRGQRRDLGEIALVLDDLRRGLEMHLELTAAMYARADYDLVVDVVSETHCGGHQLWSLHDPTHPDHDPAALAALGGDPLLPIYRLVDELVGVHLDHLGANGVAYVLASHGMQSHFDGTLLLDEILWRLDQQYGGFPTPWIGPRTGRIARLSRPARTLPNTALGAIARHTLGRRPATPTPPGDIPGPANRLWYQLENNTVCGAVRFNRVGREPNGKLDGPLLEHATGWLIEQLRTLINIDTGRPAITDAYPTEGLYARDLDDGLPDLILEWDHTARIDRVWSPSIGTICHPYDGHRTGDHGPLGEVYAVGGGLSSSDHGRIQGADLAPTIAAAIGVDMPDATGGVAAGLVPARRDATHPDTAPRQATPLRQATSPPPAAPIDDDLEVRALRRSLIELRDELRGLASAHHETRVLAESARERATVAADILATSSWIAEQTVAEELLVSIVIPTRNRAARLGDAVRSVLTQSYTNLELIVVDDGSTDDTALVLDSFADPRMRRRHNGVSLGEGGARNAGLDVASGDVVCFLDDDNTFDRHWLRSVVWLFGTQPDASVAYGARLIDDRRRHEDHIAGGLPYVELNEWDEDAMAERCLVDVNVLAHRRSGTRFRTDLPLFTDWMYLLDLTATSRPVRLPVIAARYTTDGPDRATFVHRSKHDELLERVRAEGAADDQSADGPGVQATSA